MKNWNIYLVCRWLIFDSSITKYTFSQKAPSCTFFLHVVLNEQNGAVTSQFFWLLCKCLMENCAIQLSAFPVENVPQLFFRVLTSFRFNSQTVILINFKYRIMKKIQGFVVLLSTKIKLCNVYYLFWYFLFVINNAKYGFLRKAHGYTLFNCQTMKCQL